MEHRAEFHPIKQKYFLCEKNSLHDDPLSDSIYEYFKKSSSRILGYLVATLFFLILLIPAIALQQDYIEVDVLGGKGGTFVVKQDMDPPISLYIFSKEAYLLLDVQLYLDRRIIEQFTIQEQITTNHTHTITSNKSFNFSIKLMIIAVRLMSQFSYVPTTFLIIQIVMFALSFLYLILEVFRKQKL